MEDADDIVALGHLGAEVLVIDLVLRRDHDDSQLAPP
jgi:hypothetical protein